MMEAEDTEPAVECSINTSSDQSLSLGTRPRDHLSMSRGRIRMNVCLLCGSFFVWFLGFMSLQNLESSMNSNHGLGLKSQAVMYACAMLSALLLPDLLVKEFGAKRTLVVTLLCSIPFLAANYNPRFWTLMSTSALTGIAIGPQSALTAVYMNEMAQRYHKHGRHSMEVILAWFYGIMFFFLENTQIWGNLASYYILKPGFTPIIPNPDNTSSCGVNFDGTSQHSKVQPPTDDQRHLLVSVYILSSVMSAVLMGLFMDKLENDVDRLCRGRRKWRMTLTRLWSATKHASKSHQVLILPITVYLGMSTSFYTGTITAAYIACSWGVHHVGFVTVCFGVCGAITALLVGPLVKYFSQMAVILLAACANLSTCIFLFFWQPTPDAPYTYFIVAGVWGMGDAIWWSQVTALYGLMFPDDREAAFSNLYFWSFLGFFLSYSYANYFSVAVKMYILLTFLTTGILGYLIGQIRIRCASRTQYVAIDQDEQ